MLTQTQNAAADVLLTILALTTLGLGAAPLMHNPWKRTHHAFAAFAACLALYYLSAIARDAAPGFGLWDCIQAAALALIPSLFCHFMLYLPHQRFEGSVLLLASCYACSAMGAFFTLAQTEAAALGVAPWLAAPMLVLANMLLKLRYARGVHRRQLLHLCCALVLTAAFALGLAALNLPGEGTPAPTAALILLAGWTSVLLVRYHLPDVRWVIARILVSASLCAAVAAMLFASLELGRRIFDGAPTGQIATMGAAALFVALAIQPLREILESLVKRGLLCEHFDTEAFLARINRCSVTCRSLDRLLPVAAEDLRATLQARRVRVWLCEPTDPDTVALAYSSADEPTRHQDLSKEFLLAYLRTCTEPLVLERLVHRRPTEAQARIAQELAELDCYLLVPLHSRLGLVGFLGLGQKRDADIYSAEEVRAADHAATPLSHAIESVRLYEELSEINRRLQGVLTAMHGGVLVIDPKGRIRTINREAQRMLGGLTVGASLVQLPTQVVHWIERASRQRRSVRDIELTLAGPDGEDLPIALSVCALEDDGGAPPGTLVHLYDMTEIKRLEATVRRADQLNLIGTLAASMAHEIKNPLQSIKTFTQLLLDRFDDADFRKTYAEVVPPEVRRIDDIVSGLLHFARPRPAQFAPQDVRASIDHVLALVGSQLRKHDIAVMRNFPECPVLVRGDEQHLHQVFLNLVLNAVAAMEEVAERRLNFEVLPVHASLPVANGGPVYDEACVRIVVSDTGRGIPSEDLGQVFTPFFTTSVHGSGLGLAVVHSIVSDHRGSIEISSVLGVGTSVTVTLPAAGTTADEEEAAP